MMRKKSWLPAGAQSLFKRMQVMTKEISIKLEAELRLMAQRGYSLESVQCWCANKKKVKS
jgi:hypothetical protein